MEYSIFQNFQYFSCLYIFLEYSWNFPYSKKIKFYLVASFLEYSMLQKIQDFLCCKFFLEYDIIYIPRKKLNLAWKISFLNIPAIFHIPKISIFPLLKVFLEYSWNIPYSKYFNISLLTVYIGIFHF